MSRIPLIGVVGAKHWSSMANAMVECLDPIIIKGQKTKIPLGVFYDAKNFFKIVLGQKTGDTMFDNHLAQLNAHVIAWEVLNNCRPDLISPTREEADGHFLRFVKLLEKLGEPAALGEEDKKTVYDLRDFFTALLRKGAREGRH